MVLLLSEVLLCFFCLSYFKNECFKKKNTFVYAVEKKKRMSVLPEYISEYSVGIWNLWKSKEGIKSPRTGVTGG